MFQKKSKYLNGQNPSMSRFYCYCLAQQIRYRHIRALLHKVTFIAVDTSFRKSNQMFKRSQRHDKSF